MRRDATLNKIQCPNCNRNFRIIRNGTYRINEKRLQKLKCKNCGRVFNERSNTIYKNLRTPRNRIDNILHLFNCGYRISHLSKKFGYKEDTIRKWWKLASEKNSIKEKPVKPILRVTPQVSNIAKSSKYPIGSEEYSKHLEDIATKWMGGEPDKPPKVLLYNDNLSKNNQMLESRVSSRTKYSQLEYLKESIELYIAHTVIKTYGTKIQNQLHNEIVYNVTLYNEITKDNTVKNIACKLGKSPSQIISTKKSIDKKIEKYIYLKKNKNTFFFLSIYKELIPLYKTNQTSKDKKQIQNAINSLLPCVLTKKQLKMLPALKIFHKKRSCPVEQRKKISYYGKQVVNRLWKFWDNCELPTPTPTYYTPATLETYTKKNSDEDWKEWEEKLKYYFPNHETAFWALVAYTFYKR